MDALITQATSQIVDLVGSDLPLAYQSGHGVRLTVRGIYDAAHEKQELGELGVVTQGPQVFLQLEGLPTDPEHDLEARIYVGDVPHSIHACEKDGKGGALLRLRGEQCTAGA